MATPLLDGWMSMVTVLNLLNPGPTITLSSHSQIQVSDADGAPLKAGPLKRSSRVLEKVMLREDDEGNADRVCDVRRALIVVRSMAEFSAVLAVFVKLAGSSNTTIVIVRIKDRISAPAAGWRDVMINFYVVGAPNRHVCEVQVAHLKMLTARAGLDGHAVYGRVRNSAEQLEKLGIEYAPCLGGKIGVENLASKIGNPKVDLAGSGLDAADLAALATMLKKKMGKKIYYTAAPKLHPNRGGNTQAFQVFSNAYDKFKTYVNRN